MNTLRQKACGLNTENHVLENFEWIWCKLPSSSSQKFMIGEVLTPFEVISFMKGIVVIWIKTTRNS